MAKLSLNRFQIHLLNDAKKVLEIIDEVLEGSNFELVLEGENMFLRTKDEKNVFKIYDSSLGGPSSSVNALISLPRTMDSQGLLPILIDGKEPEWIK